MPPLSHNSCLDNASAPRPKGSMGHLLYMNSSKLVMPSTTANRHAMCKRNHAKAKQRPCITRCSLHPSHQYLAARVRHRNWQQLCRQNHAIH
eukprot:4938878-Amphidinium_carterae.1